MTPRRRVIGSRLTVLAFALAAPAWGQDPLQLFRNLLGLPPRLAPTPQQATPAERANRPNFPSDQAIRRRLDEAQQLFDDRQTAAALQLIQAVLDAPSDSYFEIKPNEVKSSRQWAEELIVQRGDDCVREYQKHFGDQAQHLLDQAIAADDEQLLVSIMRRFFLTTAGRKATNRLATLHLDHGRHRLAVAFFDRLLESPAHRQQVDDAVRIKRAVALQLLGEATPAQEAIASLSAAERRLGGGLTTPGDLLTRVTVPTDVDVPALATRHWPVAGGNERRSTRSDLGLPLLLAQWSQPLADRTDVLSLVSDLGDDIALHNPPRPLLFGNQPVVWDGTVFVRTYRGTSAIDLATGKSRWHTTEGIAVEQSLAGDRAGMTPHLFAQEYTIIGNTILGQLAVDGQRVYQIDRLFFGPHYQQHQRSNAKESEPRPDRNRLTALHCENGQPIWTIEKLALEPGVPAEPVYFLGPPLPVGDDLFALLEVRGEVTLVCLDPATGTLRWQQVLALPDHRIETDPYRRSQSAYLAYADGVLVCAANLYRLQAIDPSSRVILWDYSAAGDNPLEKQRHFDSAQAPMPPNPKPADWPIIVGGRVLCSIGMGKNLHCLDLQTGRSLWKVDRSNDVHLAGVSGDQVLSVGATSLRSLDLATGVQQWRVTTPLIAGRGVFLRNQYLQPLADSRIQVFDPKTGEKVNELVDRQDAPVGNLIAVEDHLLACGLAGVRSFQSIDQLQQSADALLRADAQSVTGQFQSALLALGRNEAAQALRQLCQVIEQQPSAPTEQLQPIRQLVWSLVGREAITQPELIGPHRATLEQFAQSSTEQGLLLRTLAEHLLAKGDRDGALAAVQRHRQLNPKEFAPSPDGVLERSASVWARSLEDRIDRSSDPNERDQRRLPIAHQTQRLLAEGKLDELEQSVKYGHLTEADLAALADLERAQNRWRLAEHYYLQLSQSKSPSVAQGGAIGLWRVAAGLGQPADEHRRLQTLSFDHPESRFDGKTLHDWFFQRAPELEKQLQARRQSESWKYAAIKTSVANRRSTNAHYRMFYPLPPTLPDFTDKRFVFDQNEMSFELHDSITGKTEWEVKLPRQQVYYHAGLLGVRSQGRTVYINKDHSVHALWLGDLEKAGVANRLLWSRPLAAESTASPAATQRIGSLGPIGPNFLAVRSGKKLVVLDPLTGEVLWVRSKLRPSELIAGDESAIIIVNTQRSKDSEPQIMILDPADGRVIEQRSAPGLKSRRLLHHRTYYAVEGSPEGKERHRIIDLLDDKVVWEKVLPPGTKKFQQQDRPSLFLEPTGALTLLDLQTGKVILEHQASDITAKDVTRLDAFDDMTHWYFALIEQSRGQFSYPSSVGNLASHQVNGPVFCFEKATGKLVWRRRIENRSMLVDAGYVLPVGFCLGGKLVDKPMGQKQLVTTIDVIDKRQGDVVYSKEFDEYMGFSEIAFDVSQAWVELRSWRNTIRLEFLSQEQAADEKPEVRPSKAKEKQDDLLDRLGRFLFR